MRLNLSLSPMNIAAPMVYIGPRLSMALTSANGMDSTAKNWEDSTAMKHRAQGQYFFIGDRNNSPRVECRKGAIRNIPRKYRRNTVWGGGRSVRYNLIDTMTIANINRKHHPSERSLYSNRCNGINRHTVLLSSQNIGPPRKAGKPIPKCRLHRPYLQSRQRLQTRQTDTQRQAAQEARRHGSKFLRVIGPRGRMAALSSH